MVETPGAVAGEGAVERQIRRGYSTQFGGVTLTALDPVDPLTGDANGDSKVLRLSCGSVDVLLAGDANADSEAGMLADPSVVLDADVLKVGHHGSSTSTTDAFLDAVTPQEAVISMGAGHLRPPGPGDAESSSSPRRDDLPDGPQRHRRPYV